MRPYATDSIWKRQFDRSLPRTPAGTANMTDAAGNKEIVHLFDASKAVTMKQVDHYGVGTWGNRCATKGPLQGQITVPQADWDNPHSSLYLDDKNNQVDILLPDGDTLVPYQAGTICGDGSFTARERPSHSISGDGRHGGRGASQLSHGGLLRPIDFESATIDHALDIIANPDYMSGTTNGYRWPAYSADGGYNNPSSANYYAGSVPSMKMGSLCTIPENTDFANLPVPVTDPFVLKLAEALIWYGAYMTESSAWDCWYIGTGSDASSQFSAVWTTTNGGTRDQWLQLVKLFEVVEQTY